MDLASIIAVGAGLVVGAVLAWIVAGLRWKRALTVHDAERKHQSQAIVDVGDRLKIAEAERDAAVGEMQQSGETLRQSQQTWIREQAVAAELLTTTEGRIDRLSAEIGQLREQLGLTQRDLATQRKTGGDLEKHVESLGEEARRARAVLDARQHELAQLQQEGDTLRDQLGRTAAERRTTRRGRRWRIDTFFDG